MTFGISFLAGGLLILLIGLICWISGAQLGFPVKFAAGLVAFGISTTGIFLVSKELLNSDDQRGSGQDDSTRNSLSKLHQDTVNKFTSRAGFGENRMPPPPRMSPESAVVRRVFQNDIDLKSTNIHADGKDFLKSWESDDGPNPGEKSRWTVRKVQLVGLSKNPSPVVYLTDHLPKMDKVKEVPTRGLDSFEAAALERLRGGQELHSITEGKNTRMMAPIFATANCVSCHTQQGQMLGAFTYEIERVRLEKSPMSKDAPIP